MKIDQYEINKALIESAKHELKKNVRDPGSEKIITRYWEQAGWLRWMRNEVGQDLYKRTSGVDWCGMFVSHCANQIGQFLREDKCLDVEFKKNIRLHVLPSTYRLQSKSHWKKAGVKEIPYVKKEDLKEGDVVVLRWSGGPHYGNHITICREIIGDKMITIEGNARSEDSSHRGVVKRIRNKSDIAKIYRLKPDFFVTD